MASPYPGPKDSPGTSARIGRPPQWTSSRSRKLARLYMYTTLSVDKILKVLEDDVFKPRKNSAQKTIHNMLDHDPRYLRPESREDMNQRLKWLSASPGRRRGRPSSNLARRDEDVVMAVKPEAEQEVRLDGMGEDGVLHGFYSWKGLHATPGDASQAHGFGPPSPHGMAQGQASGYFQTLPQNRFHPATEGKVRRKSEADSTSSDASTQSVQDLKNRLSGCSTHYATQISSLLRKFTIGSESDLLKTSQSPPNPGSIGSAEDLPTEVASFDGSYALPGDFFKVFKGRDACARGPSHDAGHCWCLAADSLTGVSNLWITEDGELSPMAQRILHDPSRLNLNRQDRFGNTPLHLFAAREGFHIQLLTMIQFSDNLAATNTGGQTFLHVLEPSWFSNLHDQYAPLFQLLSHLRARHPDLVFLRDVYGRTFFHRLTLFVPDTDLTANILQHYDRLALSARDAFASTPLPLPSRDPLLSPRLTSPLDDESSPPSPFASEDAFIRHHESLLRIVTTSDSHANVEDSEGRNGLHCLAQAIVDQQMMDEHRNALAAGRLPSKRRFDKKQPDGGEASGGATTPQLATRLRLIQGLLNPTSVDINHYDRAGNTVLMAFVMHIPDDQEDKSKNLATILETLINAGARIEGRNRKGETALLVAARLGRKIALTTLLDHGASVHARDIEGRGVLDVIDEHCRGPARRDITLYGRLEACRVILTSKKHEGLGVVQSPTVVDEWSVKRGGGEMMDLSI